MTRIVIEGDVKWTDRGRGVRVANDEVELFISTDYGPRVLLYAPRGGKNVFGFVPPRLQAKPTRFGDSWHIYGGHRLWHAPEDAVLSYIPDNGPVPVRNTATGVVVGGSRERGTSLMKQMQLTLDEEGSRVVVEHRIENAGDEPVDLAVWALSVMAPGGTAIFPNAPFVPFPDELLPVSRLVLWPYTSLADSRFELGSRYLRLRQDPRATTAQKIGLLDTHHGWAAYAQNDVLFVKCFAPALATAKLVDLGCNVEAFTDGSILELETLGEHVHLIPGATAIHTEIWYLFRDVSILEGDDLTAARVLEPLLSGIDRSKQ